MRGHGFNLRNDINEQGLVLYLGILFIIFFYYIS